MEEGLILNEKLKLNSAEEQVRQRQEMAAKQAQSDLTITQQLVSRIFLLFLLTGEEPLPPPTHPKGKKILSQKDIHPQEKTFPPK